MKRGNLLYSILFGLLMVFLFSFMIQEQFNLVKTRPLFGKFEEVQMPKFHLKTYKNGYYQKATEKYVSKHFGFREPILRMYNQYCWDFYRKVFVGFTCPGKENWLFYRHNVDDYYGTEMYRWFPDTESARQSYEQEVRLLNKIRGILQEYDVTLLAFVAPSKNVVYPEFLPQRDFDTTSLNAREYYLKRFAETGFPCFDMNAYFLQMKDTCSFYLFPPTGDHWNFSCVYAADSLLRFMEQQRHEQLPRIEYDNHWTSDCSIGDDKNHDLEGELNLIRPIRFDSKYAYRERDYHVVSDSTTQLASALFIGNSFLLRMMAYVPPKEVFSDFQFWYYNRVAYQGVDQNLDSVRLLNRLDYLMDADYVIWFSSASQLYRGSEGFAEDAILQLCIGEERFLERQNELIDSLYDGKADPEQVALMMRKDPEAYFPEIAGEGIPKARNPLLLTETYEQKRDIRRQIKRDPQWMLAVTSNMATQNSSLQEAIDQETENLLLGLPVLRDQGIDPIAYKKALIQQMEKKIWNNPEWIASLKKSAEEKGVELDAWVHENARYMVNQKIQQGIIILPEPAQPDSLLLP